MAPGDQSAALPGQHPLFGDLSRNWGWLLALGILSVALGVIGLGMAVMLTLVTIVYFGVLMLVGGGVQLFQAFKCTGWRSIASHVLIGALYLVAGIMIVTRPLLASVFLTWMLAVILIAVGALRLVIAFQHRDLTGWGWAVAGGVITMILGVMILARWPLDALWIIGLLLAIELIINGWTQIFLALAARGAGGVPGTGRSPGAARI